jgi:hypothetical protein
MRAKCVLQHLLLYDFRQDFMIVLQTMIAKMSAYAAQ